MFFQTQPWFLLCQNFLIKVLAKADGLNLLPVTVGLRKAFSNATAEGLGIAEARKDSRIRKLKIYDLYES